MVSHALDLCEFTYFLQNLSQYQTSGTATALKYFFTCTLRMHLSRLSLLHQKFPEHHPLYPQKANTGSSVTVAGWQMCMEDSCVCECIRRCSNKDEKARRKYRVKSNSGLSHNDFCPRDIWWVVHMQLTEIVSKVGNIDGGRTIVTFLKNVAGLICSVYTEDWLNEAKRATMGGNISSLREAFLLEQRGALGLNAARIVLWGNSVKDILLLQIVVVTEFRSCDSTGPWLIWGFKGLI